MKVSLFWWGPGPCITNVIATCRKNFSQWESSFLWKLRCHWLKFLRRVAKTLVIQGPASTCKRPNTVPCRYLMVMQKYGKNLFKAVGTVDWTWQDVPYFISFIESLSRWSSQYQSNSKSIAHDTHPYASYHLCQIWKGFIHNCGYYSPDMRD